MTNRLAGVEPPPDVFAAVMATGVLSVAAEDHHYPGISETTGVLASLGLLVLVVVVILRRRSVRWDLHDPDVMLRLFTFVAACAVLDSRLDAFPVPVRALGLVALAAWLVLIVLTMRNMAARSWRELRDRARGAWELASVGTSGLAIAATKLARHPVDQRWLVVAVTGHRVAGVLLGRVRGMVGHGRRRAAVVGPHPAGRAGQRFGIVMPADRSSRAASARIVWGSS